MGIWICIQFLDWGFKYSDILSFFHFGQEKEFHGLEAVKTKSKELMKIKENCEKSPGKHSHRVGKYMQFPETNTETLLNIQWATLLPAINVFRQPCFPVYGSLWVAWKAE